MAMVAIIEERPVVVCLCGSTRFSGLFQEMNFQETLAGRIVLSIGCDTKSDAGLGLTQRDKEQLDQLHLRKIDLADEILVINKEGYVGASTAREIAYAWQQGKRIRWYQTPPYVASAFETSSGETTECEYGGCGRRALWWCDGGEHDWFLCNLHVFRFAYPV